MMKRVKSLCLLGLIAVLLVGCSVSTDPELASEPARQEEASLDYDTYVSRLTPVTSTDLEQLLAKEQPFLLYLGRQSCPYCNIFVPKLADALEKYPRTVYYYDTEDAEDSYLADLIATYQIKTVPHMAYFEGSERVAYLEEGSQSSPEDIENLLQLLKAD